MRKGLFAAANLLVLANFCTLAIAAQSHLTRTDLVTIRNISLQAVPWAYLPQGFNMKLTDQAVHIAGEDIDRKWNLSGFDSALPGGMGVLGVQYELGMEIERGTRSDQRGVEVFDLTNGKKGALTEMPGGMIARAISPDGTMAAASVEGRLSANRGELDLIALNGGKGEIKAAFKPYAANDFSAQTVEWVRFIDNKHFLTINDQGIQPQRIILWEFTGDSLKGIWSAVWKNHPGGDPIPTPDLKYLIVTDYTGTYFVEAATGRVVGSMCDASSSSWFVNSGLELAMRPDGKMLARYTDALLQVYSLVGQPKLVCDVVMPPQNHVSGVVWAGDDDVLVNGKYLVDVAKGMIIWMYSGLDDGRDTSLFAADGRVWRVANIDSKMSLQAITIPTDDDRKTIASIDLNQVMAIKPGMKVSLEVDIPDFQLARMVRSHFEAQLRKNNMTIAADQPLKLLVVMGGFQDKTVAYHTVGSPPWTGNEDANVINRQISVGYELNGQRLWETVLYADAPLLVNIEPGQTLNQAVAQKQATNWQQLQSLELPKYVPELRDPPGFGQTAVGN